MLTVVPSLHRGAAFPHPSAVQGAPGWRLSQAFILWHLRRLPPQPRLAAPLARQPLARHAGPSCRSQSGAALGGGRWCRARAAGQRGSRLPQVSTWHLTTSASMSPFQRERCVSFILSDGRHILRDGPVGCVLMAKWPLPMKAGRCHLAAVTKCHSRQLLTHRHSSLTVPQGTRSRVAGGDPIIPPFPSHGGFSRVRSDRQGRRRRS